MTKTRAGRTGQRPTLPLLNIRWPPVPVAGLRQNQNKNSHLNQICLAPTAPGCSNRQMTNAPTSVYELIGGETGVRQLVDDFYDEMDTNPDVAAPLRALHAKDLKSSRDKLFLFLSGWFGGPSLYIEKYGHPRLRRRHFPFAIDRKGRDQWMQCMRIALSKSSLSEELQRRLDEAFYGLADHMRNTEG